MLLPWQELRTIYMFQRAQNPAFLQAYIIGALSHTTQPECVEGYDILENTLYTIHLVIQHLYCVRHQNKYCCQMACDYGCP